MELIKAPGNFQKILKESLDYKTVIFLAGSIEMGAAKDWQSMVAKEIEDYHDLLVLSPRRDDWNSDWDNLDPEPGTPLFEQIDWELRGLDQADLIYLYLAEDTISPISLLEMGLYHHKISCVYIDDKYLRRANAVITANHFNMYHTNSEDEFFSVIHQDLTII